ncbi:hypothetical protein P692DRAFT_2015257 [Suillus brevipes Sb2]|nr:hypothetical protein P692DRAFT_2015257 [Suillus brevipes Sb2]
MRTTFRNSRSTRWLLVKRMIITKSSHQYTHVHFYLCIGIMIDVCLMSFSDYSLFSSLLFYFHVDCEELVDVSVGMILIGHSPFPTSVTAPSIQCTVSINQSNSCNQIGPSPMDGHHGGISSFSSSKNDAPSS